MVMPIDASANEAAGLALASEDEPTVPRSAGKSVVFADTMVN